MVETGADKARTTPTGELHPQPFDGAEILRSGVSISANDPKFFGGSMNAAGNGFFVQDGRLPACTVVTDNHVIAFAPGKTYPWMQPIDLSNITVRTANGNEYPATRELVDRNNDIAVLAIHGVKDPAAECRGLTVTEGSTGGQAFAVLADAGKNQPRLLQGAAQSDVRRDSIKVDLLPNEDASRRMNAYGMPAVEGYSGAAIVSDRGTASGLLDITDTYTTWATPASAVLADLDKLAATRRSAQRPK